MFVSIVNVAVVVGRPVPTVKIPKKPTSAFESDPYN
jgi:hypothetical protein